MTLSPVCRQGHRRELACDFLVMTCRLSGLVEGGSQPVWRNSPSVHILRTCTSAWPWGWPGVCRAAGPVQKLGKVVGVGAAEDETVVLYCARVTQRYVQKGEVRIQGQSRTVGNGNLHRDAVGRSGVDGEARFRYGLGREPVEGGADDADGDGGPLSTVTAKRKKPVVVGVSVVWARPTYRHAVTLAGHGTGGAGSLCRPSCTGGRSTAPTAAATTAITASAVRRVRWGGCANGPRGG